MLGFAIGTFSVVAAILAISIIIHTFALVRVALRELRQERDAAIREWALMDALRTDMPRRDAVLPEPALSRLRPLRPARAPRQHPIPAHAPMPRSLAENM